MIKQSHSWRYIWKTTTLILKDMCTSIFTAASFTIFKTWKQFKCPSTYDWFKKMRTYEYNGILLGQTRE